jgi:hypothetical protein
VSNATVNHHGPQRIGIKTKIRTNSHHPAERFREGGGATLAVFSEGSIVPSPLSPAHLISYSPLEAASTPDLSRTRKSVRQGPATGFMHPSETCIQVCFGAKGIQDRRIVLFERAGLIRVHRINPATSKRGAGTRTNCPNAGVGQETPNEAKKNSQNVKHFSLKCFAGFLPISNIRGRLSLHPSPTCSDGK